MGHMSPNRASRCRGRPAQDNGDGVAPLPRTLPEPLIAEGAFVVLEQQSEKTSLLCVRANRCVHSPAAAAARRLFRARAALDWPCAALAPRSTAYVGGATVSLAPLVGCPYGSRFDIVSGALRRAAGPPALVPRADLAADERSNKHLLDDGSAQALDGAAIAALKRKGASGAAVVDALVASSATAAARRRSARTSTWRARSASTAPQLRRCAPRRRAWRRCCSQSRPSASRT